ncbi:hydrogenase expression/formation protein HypE [Pelotomaculum propionicicum]|uniref:Hydrogenase isoenzymes formation protein HypE n=1 Tax=Pelotomaculum propionicicum TaxID=258475 RepID=A0A4Y7RTG3_9FIRM|nr:hydrogenase expression/formation protein HypE [Pelotomaculum propionicicum]TEB12050.1 Hydrogenase isoenzymes formation protein HypE [Pelotomaculum propionicicum]
MSTNENELILLAHGDGGLLTHQLLEKYFLPGFSNELLDELSDASVFSMQEGRLAVSTDSFVVDPIFFPGGNIGKLAVCGTVNDIAVSGARPLYLTASFILEEGLPLGELARIVASMSDTAVKAGVKIIAGDTKVVGRGQADKIFITTTGIGLLPPQVNLGYRRLKPGDKVLVNGSLGNHGLAILLQRETLGLDSKVESDCAPLNLIIEKLLKRFKSIKIMRDLTRGGLATNAKEIAQSARVDIWLDEQSLPVDDSVRGVTELLGLDPLYLANEGKFLIAAAADEAADLLDFMKKDSLGENSRLIGEVRAGSGNVYLKTALGGTRKINMLASAPLPRIC